MREILFRGKNVDSDKWEYGFYVHQYGSHQIYLPNGTDDNGFDIHYVIPETVGQYTGLTDKNGQKVFEGDIIQYITPYDFDCQSVVKFGKYEQDGSGGEYGTATCIGFYAEVENFTCPDWTDDPDEFKDYLKQQSLLEIEGGFEIIGNIHDNPEILK